MAFVHPASGVKSWARSDGSSRVGAKEEKMSETIVVGTDGSETAKRAVKEAVRLAKALQAELHVVGGFQPMHTRISGAPTGAAKVWQPLPDSHIESTIEQAAASVRLAGAKVKTHVVR